MKTKQTNQAAQIEKTTGAAQASQAEKTAGAAQTSGAPQRKKTKILLCIADGLGDRPCPALDYKTPLQAAHTPTLDLLARKGSTGIMDLYRAGTPVGTDLGHMILFGYEKDDYAGRGPVEAFGVGLALQAGDVAFRANFATCDDAGVVLNRRAGRIRKDTDKLAAALNGMRIDDVEVLFKEATEHRAVLVFRGDRLSARLTDTDPKVENALIKQAHPSDKTDEARRTAALLDRFIAEARKILADHPVNRERIARGLLPANCILTRGAGLMPQLKTQTELHHITAACVAGESTVLGVAKLAGFDVVTEPSFTGNIDTDIDLKAQRAAELLETHDFVVLHFKATDLMGHDGNPQGKKKAVEKYDALLEKAVRLARRNAAHNVIVALAADHSTPCERYEHSGDPVPILIQGENFRADTVTTYDECACAQGGLGRILGRDFNNILLDYLEASKKEGN